MRKYGRSKLPGNFVGHHLFLEVRICNALLCSTKVFGVKRFCVRQGKCSLTASERFVDLYLTTMLIDHLPSPKMTYSDINKYKTAVNRCESPVSHSPL